MLKINVKVVNVLTTVCVDLTTVDVGTLMVHLYITTYNYAEQS